ncbi:hypothetical protein MPSYJ_50060 [Mycolicibacterium psychrotolerans]|uniref:Uncharacterized protein n=1 Tax=Mycolicibacterium psychrotolerans TaxID=216929 RepID=A0A7I7MHA7_9MYCO|nr:hypothetical protein MPSYJ_50060 [Mycolicibacterium psychrotolerans]
MVSACANNRVQLGVSDEGVALKVEHRGDPRRQQAVSVPLRLLQVPLSTTLVVNEGWLFSCLTVLNGYVDVLAVSVAMKKSSLVAK